MACTCKTDVFQKISDLADAPANNKWDVLKILAEMQKEIGKILADTVATNCSVHGGGAKKPPRTADEFVNHLGDMIKNNGLQGTYNPDDPRLREIAEKAAEYVKNNPDGPLTAPDETGDLATLGLYDNICFIDDSGSMKEENRIDSLKKLMHTMIKITGYLDYDGIQVRCINHANDSVFNDIYDDNQVDNVFDLVKFDGSTPLGTKLKEKVVTPMIVAKLAGKTLRRPVIVSIISDGEPNEEPKDQLQTTIKECKAELLKHGYDQRHVLFQISQIGTAAGAKGFLEGLNADKSIRKLLYLTSGSLDKQMELYHENENHLQRWLLKIMLAPVYK